MRDLAYELQALLRRGEVSPTEVGHVLDSGWKLKRQLASTVSTSQIDEWYEQAMAAGASGGKLCGAGGGGFLLLIVSRDCQDAVRKALWQLRPVQVQPESHGSQI